MCRRGILRRPLGGFTVLTEITAAKKFRKMLPHELDPILGDDQVLYVSNRVCRYCRRQDYPS